MNGLLTHIAHAACPRMNEAEIIDTEAHVESKFSSSLHSTSDSEFQRPVVNDKVALPLP